MKSKRVDMLSGSIYKGLLSMTVPIIIVYLMALLFCIVDMTVLKMFSAGNAVGAVGASGTLVTLFNCLPIGLSVGVNVVVARRIGAGDRDRVDRAVMTSILMAIVGGFIFAIVGVVFAEIFLKMTNCPESLLNQATLYFKIILCGFPVMGIYTFCAAILRATGDTKRPMYFGIINGATKVVLTIVFVAVLKTGVAGVAVATIIANAVVSILSFIAVSKSKEVITVDLKNLKFDKTEFMEVLRMGVPVGLQSGLYSFANVVIATAVNGFGADATTGVAIANQFDGILYNIIHSPSVATIPFIAQNIGAKNMKRVKQIISKSIVITMAFGISFGILSTTFSRQLSSIMTSSPAVIEYSYQKMVIVSSTYFICGINEVLGGVLKGMGKPIYPTVASLIFMCLLRFVWVYGLFPHFPNNISFLYLVWPVGWILSIAMLLVCYIREMKKLQNQCMQIEAD